jgi:hypothetical protein
MDMGVPADATTADKLKLMSLKKEVMSSVLSAGVRINDGALRRKDDDKVARMLREVKKKSSDSVGAPAVEEVTIIDLFG